MMHGFLADYDYLDRDTHIIALQKSSDPVQDESQAPGTMDPYWVRSVSGTLESCVNRDQL
jgi:hypothetical protein